MENSTVQIEKMAGSMRKMALDMAYSAGKYGAHLGGGLSAIEILAVLYGAVLQFDPGDPFWADRDRVLLGKAHGVLAYYTALYEAGLINGQDIASFETNGSKFIGHPMRNIEKGIDYSGGSLGMALSVGCGLALSAKRRESSGKVYVILGDGECQEGSIWEALIFAVKYQLDNLILIVDQNGLQSDGRVADIAGTEDLAKKMVAFGCSVTETDGHDVKALLHAFQSIESNGRPTAIVAKTVKGKGVSFMENDYKWHHSQLSQKQYEIAISEVKNAYQS